MEKFRIPFVKKLKALRATTGLTQLKFSSLLKVQFRTYQNWEGGSRAPEQGHLALRGIKTIVDEFIAHPKSKGKRP